MATVQSKAPARTGGAESGVRERIMDTASRLFYREGIQAVGIQRLIDEAGIAKASLYAHFPSKDDLVAAYLERQTSKDRAHVAEVLAAPGLSGRAKILRLFDQVVAYVEQPEFRGCPTQNVCSETADNGHPAYAIVQSHRAWLRETLRALVRESGAASPDSLAGALLVLIDGAQGTALMDHTPGAARDARWAAEQLLDHAMHPAGRHRRKPRVRR